MDIAYLMMVLRAISSKKDSGETTVWQEKFNRR
jgi:hypothetical protein